MRLPLPDRPGRGFALALAIALGLAHLGQNSPVATAQSQAVVYHINAKQSRFIVQAFKGGLFRAFAHNHTIAVRDFTGEVRLTPGSINSAALRMTVKANSLTVVDDVSAGDKQKIEQTMRQDVLETAKYPTITFQSTKVVAAKTSGDQYQVKLDGDLTLHGVTRAIQINTRMTLSDKSLTAHGEFPLKQTDYNISPVSVAGGTIKVKNGLKLSFDIVAHP